MAARIRKNDTVLVIAGKERGKRGTVARILPEKNRVMVEGVNIVKRHMKPRGATQPGGIVEKEAPLHLSNVMLVCTRCDHPVRVSFRLLEGGAKVRVCRHCGEIVD
ncbi:MAG TPA: 50S ribosomal protein L24 [Dehalococcoidia bacterium]|nr:50S ribosomal protein L24 [Dehalococcoidia bacterium]